MDFFSCVGKRTRSKRKHYSEILEGRGSLIRRSEEKESSKTAGEKSPLDVSSSVYLVKKQESDRGTHGRIEHGSGAAYYSSNEELGSANFNDDVIVLGERKDTGKGNDGVWAAARKARSQGEVTAKAISKKSNQATHYYTYGSDSTEGDGDYTGKNSKTEQSIFSSSWGNLGSYVFTSMRGVNGKELLGSNESRASNGKEYGVANAADPGEDESEEREGNGNYETKNNAVKNKSPFSREIVGTHDTRFSSCKYHIQSPNPAPKKNASEMRFNDIIELGESKGNGNSKNGVCGAAKVGHKKSEQAPQCYMYDSVSTEGYYAGDSNDYQSVFTSSSSDSSSSVAGVTGKRLVGNNGSKPLHGKGCKVVKIRNSSEEEAEEREWNRNYETKNNAIGSEAHSDSFEESSSPDSGSDDDNDDSEDEDYEIPSHGSYSHDYQDDDKSEDEDSGIPVDKPSPSIESLTSHDDEDRAALVDSQTKSIQESYNKKLNKSEVHCPRKTINDFSHEGQLFPTTSQQKRCFPAEWSVVNGVVETPLIRRRGRKSARINEATMDAKSDGNNSPEGLLKQERGHHPNINLVPDLTASSLEDHHKISGPVQDISAQCKEGEKVCQKDEEVKQKGRHPNINLIPDMTASSLEDRPKISGSVGNISAQCKEEEKVCQKDEEIKQLPKTIKHVRAKNYDTFRIFVDSILHPEDVLDRKASDHSTKKPLESAVTLPYKFSFEDEKPKPPEKSAIDKLADALFSELDFAKECDAIGSSFNPEEIANTGDAQKQKCEHQFVLDEEIGLKCVICYHLEIEIKDYVPPFAPNARVSRRKGSPSEEEITTLDGLGFETSSDHNAGSRFRTTGTVWDRIPGVRDTLYEHQQDGFEFLWRNLAGTINLSQVNADSSGVGGCIISHAPGTGKTRLAIVFIDSYLKLYPSSCPVIIAPASMLLTWEEEFRKWGVKFPVHNLSNKDLSGKENKAALSFLSTGKSLDVDAVRLLKLYSWSKEDSVLLISYNLFEKLAGKKTTNRKGHKEHKRIAGGEEPEEWRKILIEKPGLVILDEGHTARNKRSGIWNTLLQIKTEKRILLSGTPFQNNFEELFNTLQLMRPPIANDLRGEKIFSELLSSRRISRRQIQVKGTSSSRDKLREDAIPKLKAKIEPFVHVHKGTILQQSLPGLKDSVVILNPQELQKSLIQRIEGSQNTFEFEHKVGLISVHPCLHTCCSLSEKEIHGISQDELEDSRFQPAKGVKTRFLMELIRLSVANHEKVLVFSQYIDPLNLIRDQLGAAFNWQEGKQVLLMEGQLDQNKRQRLINYFNDPESEAKVLLASTKCCSEGISLIGASRVVLLDVVWNPSVERQAISRAYRLGQEKVVYTYHLMTSGTTEAKKYRTQADKERLSELVFTSAVEEVDKLRHPAAVLNDKILEALVGHEKLKDMFERVIYQPKETNLVDTFG